MSDDDTPVSTPAVSNDAPTVQERPKRRSRKPKPADGAQRQEGEAGEGSSPSKAAETDVASVEAKAQAGEDGSKRRRNRSRKSADQQPDEMTQMTRDATKASSEPTPMPAITLSEKPTAPDGTLGEDSPYGTEQGQGEGGSRRRRRQPDHAGGTQAPSGSQGSGGNNANGGNQQHNSSQHNGGGSNNSQGRRQNSNQTRRNRNRHNQQGTPTEPSLSRDDLQEMKVAELRERAVALDVEYVGVRKAELVEAVYAAAAAAEGFRPVSGVLQIGNEGYGWIRTGNYMEGDNDAFVHQQLIRSLGLRPGDKIEGTVGPGRSNSKYPPLQQVKTVNGRSPEGLKNRPRFRDLTPIYPNERLVMECGKDSITGRAIDLVAPIGKGQRGLIVSPPKAGKTTVLKKICQSIAANNPEVHLFCLLVDERPEEVTDMERSIRGEVVASTFDMPAENHTQVSELVIEHAKRLVEQGEDVVVVLDSITRLARAYNLASPPSGRILSGGVDSAALYPPKKFLGAARNIENGGSLTIIASALVDTGSKMDEVIFEEFKGTGNMELKLDRELADKRIFPAIDPVASGTRNEDLLISADYQPFVWGIRRVLANMNSTERAANSLVKGLKQTDTNEEFLIRSAKKAAQTDYIA